MPFNGSGGYVPTNPPPFVFNTIISESQMNAALNDIAAALSLVLVRDGQAAMTGALNMGSQNINAVGNGSSATPSIKFTQGGGFYSGGTDIVCVATAGNERMRFGATGAAAFRTEVASSGFTSWQLVSTVKGYIGFDGGGILGTGTSTKFGIRSEGELLLMANAADNWRIDTGNRLVNPGNTQPAFRAYRNVPQTSGSLGDIIVFDTEVYDQGGNYNNSTGVFTAPVGGLYHFDFHTYLDNTLGSTTGHNTFLVAAGINVLQCAEPIATGTVNTVQGAITLRLAANDQVTVRLPNNLSASLTMHGGADRCFFDGYLVG